MTKLKFVTAIRNYFSLPSGVVAYRPLQDGEEKISIAHTRSELLNGLTPSDKVELAESFSTVGVEVIDLPDLRAAASA